MSDAIAIVLLVGVGSVLLLSALIASETSNPTVVDRREAERDARRRGGLEQKQRGDGEPNGTERSPSNRSARDADPTDRAPMDRREGER